MKVHPPFKRRSATRRALIRTGFKIRRGRGNEAECDDIPGRSASSRQRLQVNRNFETASTSGSAGRSRFDTFRTSSRTPRHTHRESTDTARGPGPARPSAAIPWA